MAENDYSAGDITFTVSTSIAEASPAMVLTDDYGMTYYKSGSDTILDTDLLDDGDSTHEFAAGVQYVTMTIAVEASTTGNISDALNGVAGLTFSIAYEATSTGDAADSLKYHNSAEGAPAQGAWASSSTDGYTQETKTKSGSSVWINKAVAQKKWSAGTAPSASTTVTLESSYAFDSNHTKTVYTATYYLGLAGSNSDQSGIAEDTITLGVELEDGTLEFDS